MTHGTDHAPSSSNNHGHTRAVTIGQHAVATQPSSRSVKRVAQAGAVVGVATGPRSGPQPIRVSSTARKGSGTSKQAGHKAGKHKKTSIDESGDLEKPIGSRIENDDYYDDMATGFLQFWYVCIQVQDAIAFHQLDACETRAIGTNAFGTLVQCAKSKSLFLIIRSSTARRGMQPPSYQHAHPPFPPSLPLNLSSPLKFPYVLTYLPHPHPQLTALSAAANATPSPHHPSPLQPTTTTA